MPTKAHLARRIDELETQLAELATQTDALAKTTATFALMAENALGRLNAAVGEPVCGETLQLLGVGAGLASPDWAPRYP